MLTDEPVNRPRSSDISARLLLRVQIWTSRLVYLACRYQIKAATLSHKHACIPPAPPLSRRAPASQQTAAHEPVRTNTHLSVRQAQTVISPLCAFPQTHTRAVQAEVLQQQHTHTHTSTHFRHLLLPDQRPSRHSLSPTRAAQSLSRKLFFFFCDQIFTLPVCSLDRFICIAAHHNKVARGHFTCWADHRPQTRGLQVKSGLSCLFFMRTTEVGVMSKVPFQLQANPIKNGFLGLTIHTVL